MRKSFVSTVEDLLATDENLVLLLGDIGVFGFRNAFKAHPERVYNVGICEQAMTSLGAGLAKEGFIPVIHSIAPFVVERCYEQLKIGFVYQKLQGNVVSVGASYDYAALGYTHHCPGDVGALKVLPGCEIVVPGTAAEYDTLFRDAYDDGNLTYFRLTEQSNRKSREVRFGKAEVIRQGSLATVIAVGPMLDKVIGAAEGMDVTILYYTTLAPFDGDTLREQLSGGKIMVVEPYYAGALLPDIHRTLTHTPLVIESVGVPHQVITKYGDCAEHDEHFGLTPERIGARLKELIHG